MSESVGKWLVAHDEGVSASGKTRRWAIYPVGRDLVSALEMPGRPGFNASLGSISWYGPWRRYAFYPNAHTILEQECLREIADFCEVKTKAHVAALKAARG